MASAVKSNDKNEAQETSSPSKDTCKGSVVADVQSYLISNYREALKRGDKSAAKSCLLAARYFSVNDPSVTNEIYIMAKSDGDISEASKCFASIFSDLFGASNQFSLNSNASNELLAVISQIKEETRILLNELKTNFLKLKSLPTPTTLTSHQLMSSVNPSPMLSPKMQFSTEDKIANRESLSKLNGLPSNRSLFYQQLFDNLPQNVKRNILENSIETCDNPFERCRLIMLTLSIFNDSVTTYGTRLLRTLIDLSDPLKKLDKGKEGSCTAPRSSTMCRYAKSLLLLDAIPLVLDITPLSNLEVEFEELFDLTLNFYSDHCLETSATEYESSELHQGVKKSIAARILGTEHNSASEDPTEEFIKTTLNLLSKKFIESLTDATVIEKFEKLRSIITDKSDLNSKFDRLIEIIRNLDLEDDIPEEILFASARDDPQPINTPPPKGRGRPKRAQQSVIVSLDDGTRRHLQNKSKEASFVFYSILQHMFVSSASYLKSTRSRVLMNFNNPLAVQIESDMVAKGPSPRASRSKGGSQHNNDTGPSPAKKTKLDVQIEQAQNRAISIEQTPLNSEHSKRMDLRILTTLIEPHKCLEFLNSNFGVFTKLWNKFLTNRRITDLDWYRRISVDSMILSGQFDDMSEFLEAKLGVNNEEEVGKEEGETGVKKTSKLKKITGSQTFSVRDLRNLVQLISCHIQRTDRTKTFEKINDFLAKMKQNSLLSQDDSHFSGNIIDEYMVTVQHDGQSGLGFLFFDSLSMIRYCVDSLMNILKRFINNVNLNSDTAVGHTIVLSQFDWPKEAKIYYQCNSWLRTNKPKSATPQCLSSATKFTYPDFFNYIRNPNIIEDFMAMLCQGYTLDIKSNTAANNQTSPNSQSRTGATSRDGSSAGSRGSTTRSGKAITTRGVNKTFKEDLKVSMVSQMRNSCVLVSSDMISNFILISLIPYLSSLKK